LILVLFLFILLIETGKQGLPRFFAPIRLTPQQLIVFLTLQVDQLIVGLFCVDVSKW